MPSDSEEASGPEAQILHFCSVTGASTQVGAHYLETYSGNLELAVNMFLEQSDIPSSGITPRASTSREEMDPGVRAPIPQHQGILVEEGYDWLDMQVMRRRGSRTVFDPFRDFNLESRRQHESLTNTRPSSHSKTLDDLFRPPVDITFKGTFDHVREAGRLWHKWVLVDVQNIREFQCQCLNRDIWSNVEVRDLLKKDFVLWQVYIESIEGQKFVHFYKVKQYPYVAIIDPRTGENMQTWTKVKLLRFVDSLHAFLQIHPSDSLGPSNDVRTDQGRLPSDSPRPSGSGLRKRERSHDYGGDPYGLNLKEPSHDYEDDRFGMKLPFRGEDDASTSSRPVSRKGGSSSSITFPYTETSSNNSGEGSKIVKKGPYIPPTYALSIQASNASEMTMSSGEKRKKTKTEGESSKELKTDASEKTKKLGAKEDVERVQTMTSDDKAVTSVPPPAVRLEGLGPEKRTTCIIDADEEQQLQAAIQASISETNQVSTCDSLTEEVDTTKESFKKTEDRSSALPENIECESETQSKSDELPNSGPFSGIDQDELGVLSLLNDSPDLTACDKDRTNPPVDTTPDSNNYVEIDSSPKAIQDTSSEQPMNLVISDMKSKTCPLPPEPKRETESPLPITRTPPCPTDEERNYTLMIRYPDETKDELVMPGSTRIQALISYVAMKGFSQQEYDLMTNYPKRYLSKISQDYTLNEIGFCSQETIFVHPK